MSPYDIQALFAVAKAIYTHFYRWGSDTEDDGGGLQWDSISRCWISYTGSVEFPYDFSDIKNYGALLKGPSLWGNIVRPQIHKRKGDKTPDQQESSNLLVLIFILGQGLTNCPTAIQRHFRPLMNPVIGFYRTCRFSKSFLRAGETSPYILIFSKVFL